jgi:glycerate 2-kinase
MARAAAAYAGIRAGLIVSVEPAEVSGFDNIVGGHPIPTPASEEAGRAALALAGSVGRDERFLVLLSGGASALMAVPAGGVTLDDKRRTTDQLLRAGADIHALNTVRKHLSAIKGGRLAAHAPGVCRAFAISDVIGDDLSVIASGPTVADATTFHDALAVLQRFGGEAAYPAPVLRRFRESADETPKSGAASLARATTSVIGSRVDAMRGAESEARARGYAVIRIDQPITGDARAAARAHLESLVAKVANMPRPVCAIASGETTVHVVGHGRGGRNQEFALALVEPLASRGIRAVVASVGTDDIDGPTDAAGAIADWTTLARAGEHHLVPDRFLADNNAYAFFDLLGGLVRTGPTGTNVGDLQLFLIA